MLGLGRERVVRIPSDNNGRMRTDLLPPLDERTILCLQAGNVNTGGMDDGAVIARAKSEGAWVHIDGAFGLWAGASGLKKHLTEGYELADSWATDGHKWLNVPYDSGLVICKTGVHLRKAMSIHGDYLDQAGDRIPYHYTPELSRRARAIDIWAAIRTLGKNGIDELVTRTCVFAEYISHELQDAGFEVLNQVETNQVLVSFGEDTDRIIKEIQSDGTCWCGGTVWKGRPAMRISISSVKTTENDIKKSLEAILKLAGKKIVMRVGTPRLASLPHDVPSFPDHPNFPLSFQIFFGKMKYPLPVIRHVKKNLTQSRMSYRLKHWDYGSNAPYFITICTQNRKHFFGDISDGKMHLSDIGKIVENEWIKTPDIRPDMHLELGEFVVMPNHFHAILIIGKNCIRRQAWRRHRPCGPIISFQNKFGPQSNNLASIIRGFKSAVTTQVKKLYSRGDATPCVPTFKWQSRFHDHIIRDAESFVRIEKYIMNNPVHWNDDKLL